MWHPNIYPDGRVCISILHPPGTDRFNDQDRYEERGGPTFRATILTPLNSFSITSYHFISLHIISYSYPFNPFQSFESFVFRWQMNEYRSPHWRRAKLQETADERWRPILGVHSILISVWSLEFLEFLELGFDHGTVEWEELRKNRKNRSSPGKIATTEGLSNSKVNILEEIFPLVFEKPNCCERFLLKPEVVRSVGQDPEEGTPETTLHGWPDLA